MFQTSLTEVVFPYRFFSLNFFSKKQTFSNRWLNFSITEVTFFKHFYMITFHWILFPSMYFHCYKHSKH